VAGGEIVWNAELPLHRIEVSGFQDVGAKAGLPQVLHPTRTAAAIRVQMDGDDVFFRGNDRSGTPATTTDRRVSLGSKSVMTDLLSWAP
jgi:hypothetical protein